MTDRKNTQNFLVDAIKSLNTIENLRKNIISDSITQLKCE